MRIKVAPFDEHAQKYEEWFEKNRFAYLSELQAVESLLPSSGESLEIGVGTGRFAAPLNVGIGLEPSQRMRRMASDRGITVVGGVGERLPFRDEQFDVALMITTLCFLDDARAGFRESFRILRSGGCLVVGFIDKDSLLGREYQGQTETSPFYRVARFYSTGEVMNLMQEAGFHDFISAQTIFHGLSEVTQVEPVTSGHGEGSFVVVKGVK
jgi:SAM-dependent methyltransferase